MKLNIDPFKVGDTIQVCDKLRERKRQRIQFYLGILQIKQGIGRSTIRTILSEFNGEIKIKCIF